MRQEPFNEGVQRGVQTAYREVLDIVEAGGKKKAEYTREELVTMIDNILDRLEAMSKAIVLP